MKTIYVPASPGGLLFEHLAGISESEAWQRLLADAGYKIMSREANNKAIQYMRDGGWTVEEVQQ